MDATRLPDILVSTDWLAGRLEIPGMRIVDIRGYVKTTDLGGGHQHADYLGAADEYRDGHLPGSVYIDWTTDIVDPNNEIKAQIAPPERFAAAMEARGVGNVTDVVIVDHTGGNFATRLWWALKYYGHDRAAVLDGGYAKWVAEGRPITQEAPLSPAASFVPRPRPELLASAVDVQRAMADSTTMIVDARDAGQFSGEIARGARGGRIPSAVHVPAKSMFSADGTWKPVEELRAQFVESGVDGAGKVVAYCNGGVTATAILFALERTGTSTYANYDGSWNEWGERQDLPVERDEGVAPR